MHIHILALLLFFQSFVACGYDPDKALVSCRQGPEKAPLLEANLFSQSIAALEQGTGKGQPSATNIVFKSVDGGQTWQDVSAGLPADVSVGRVFNDGGSIVLAYERALYHSLPSSESGSSATMWEKGVPFDIQISDLFPGRNGPYISSYDKGFFKELPGTGILMPMHEALKDKTVRSILETQDGTLLVGCESGMYKSKDAGKSWKQVFSETGVNSLVEAEGVLVCGTHDGLMRSTDGGEHWDLILTEDGGAWKTSFIEGHFVALTQGAKEWHEGIQNRVRISADGGKTWQRIDVGLSAPQFVYMQGVGGSRLESINDLKKAGKFLFCSCNLGVFRSSDWGKTWEPVFTESELKLLQLAVSGDVIYAVKVVGC